MLNHMQPHLQKKETDKTAPMSSPNTHHLNSYTTIYSDAKAYYLVIEKRLAFTLTVICKSLNILGKITFYLFSYDTLK